MFNNLIESNSHTREFKRRGSFFLFTVGAYTLLFVIGGIASVYAYDAHLEEQNTELTMLTFVPPEMTVAATPPVPGRPKPTTADNGTHSTHPTAPVLYESSSNPRSAPPDVGITAPNIPPATPWTEVGPNVTSPLSSRNSGPAGTPGGTGNRVAVETEPPPPAPPKPAPKKIVIASRVLNSQALYLPKPPYPAMAKQIHLSGMVNVQVLIDETGRVVSAHAVSGHPLLVSGAVQAAQQARFSPTMIGDTPVKVSGIITYNFLLQ